MSGTAARRGRIDGTRWLQLRLVLAVRMRSFSLSLAADPAAVREVMAFTVTPDSMPMCLSAPD